MAETVRALHLCRQAFSVHFQEAFLVSDSLVILTWDIAIPEEPPTPLWELILEQFKDQLVLILLGSAAVSFALALIEEDGGWSAFVDPAVVCTTPQLGEHGEGN